MIMVELLSSFRSAKRLAAEGGRVYFEHPQLHPSKKTFKTIYILKLLFKIPKHIIGNLK